MTTPILSKLIAAGLSAALGGAGLFAVAPEAATPSPSPTTVAPATVSFATAPEPTDAGMAALLDRVDPSVLADPEIAAALHDPRVVSVLSDPEVQRALEGVDPAVLTRPAVLDAIAVRQVTPEALADPVVQANLPAILRALPTLRAAYERADTAPGSVAPAPIATTTSLPELPNAAPPESPEAQALPVPTALPTALPPEALPVLIAATSELAEAPELESLPPSVVPGLIATAAELAPALEGGEVDPEAVATAALPVVLELAGELLAPAPSTHERTAAHERRDARRAARLAERGERVNPGADHRSERANEVLSQLLGLGLRVAANSGR